MGVSNLFGNFVQTFHILRRNERDRIEICIGLHLKKPIANLTILNFEIPCLVSKIPKYETLCKEVHGNRFIPCGPRGRQTW